MRRGEGRKSGREAQSLNVQTKHRVREYKANDVAQYGSVRGPLSESEVAVRQREYQGRGRRANAPGTRRIPHLRDGMKGDT